MDATGTLARLIGPLTTTRDPVCGMAVDPAPAAAPRARGPRLSFLLRALPHPFAAAPDHYVEATDPAAACGSTGRPRGTWRSTAVTTPAPPAAARGSRRPRRFASASDGRRPSRCRRARSTPARCTPRSSRSAPGLPDLRHGAGAEGRPGRRRRAEPRVRRLPPPLRLGAALTVPLVVVAMGPMLGLPVGAWIGERTARWVELVLATPVVLWWGWPFLVRGWTSFRTGNLNMFSLIAMGVVAAYAFSIAAVLAPGLFPAGFRDHHGQVGRLLRGGGGDRRAGVARPDPRATRPRAHRRGDPGAAGPCTEDRARHPADGTEEDVPLETSRSATASAFGRARTCRSTAM